MKAVQVWMRLRQSVCRFEQAMKQPKQSIPLTDQSINLHAKAVHFIFNAHLNPKEAYGS